MPAGMESCEAWTDTSMVDSMLKEESDVLLESFLEERLVLMLVALAFQMFSRPDFVSR